MILFVGVLYLLLLRYFLSLLLSLYYILVIFIDIIIPVVVVACVGRMLGPGIKEPRSLVSYGDWTVQVVCVSVSALRLLLFIMPQDCVSGTRVFV